MIISTIIALVICTYFPFAVREHEPRAGIGIFWLNFAVKLWFVNEGSVYRCGIISPFNPLAQYNDYQSTLHPESLPARPWKVAFPRTNSMVSFFPMVFWEGELLTLQGV